MNNTVIKIEGLWKQYRYGVVSHGMLFKDLQSWWARTRGKEDPNAKISLANSIANSPKSDSSQIANRQSTIDNSPKSDSSQIANRQSAIDNSPDDRFWALRDINLEIKQGEVVGIIGRNGAGKSTLLKILSRVTGPTQGSVKVKGRIASLLEVGTGFHPELTGRENVFLNGAILGMRKIEIAKKFDEIVAFAEVEKFIDTPVKRYSSGMYVRLAFAVAAHLETDIMIIDEVLAVGDTQFQKKCLGKMGDVADRQGKTVLFVSHNMAAIEQLCKRCVLLQQGEAVRDGIDTKDIIQKYLSESVMQGVTYEWRAGQDNKFANDYFSPMHFYMTKNAGEIVDKPFRNDEEITVNIVGEVSVLNPSLYVAYGVYSEDGVYLFGTAYTDSTLDQWPVISKGPCTLKARLPKHLLNEGLYRLELYIFLLHKDTWFCAHGKDVPCLSFEIQGGLSQSPYWTEKRFGYFAPIIQWTN